MHDVWQEEVIAHAKAEIKALDDHAKTDGGMGSGFVADDVLKKLQDKGNFACIVVHFFFGCVFVLLN